jgi:hypothetical protein
LRQAAASRRLGRAPPYYVRTRLSRSRQALEKAASLPRHNRGEGRGGFPDGVFPRQLHDIQVGHSLNYVRKR